MLRTRIAVLGAALFLQVAPANAHVSAAPTPQCSNGIDDDWDGLIDLKDLECESSLDISETSVNLNWYATLRVEWRQFVPVGSPVGCIQCTRVIIPDLPTLQGLGDPRQAFEVPRDFALSMRNLDAPIFDDAGNLIPDSPNVPNLTLTYTGSQVIAGPAIVAILRTKPPFVLPASFTYAGHAFDARTNAVTRNVGKVATDQPNSCSIAGSVSYKGPGTPSPKFLTLDAEYREFGSFFEAIPTNMSMSLKPNPAVTVTGAPKAILGAALHTMGFNEGPPTLSSVGDGGRITIDWGACGKIEDSYRVTSVQPYRISHRISGNLDLSGFAGTDLHAGIVREVTSNFTAQGATGTLSLASENASGGESVKCKGRFVATHTAAHPTIPLPARVASRLVFRDDPESSGASGFVFRGTRTRVKQ